jgi:hypothetical protein
MPGIYIAAVVAGALALAFAAPFFFLSGGRRRRWLPVLLLVLQLPMAAAAFRFLRVPLDGWIKSVVADPQTYTIVTLFYAPLTEEPAKLWPIFLPFVWRHLRSENAMRLALALGLGFGIGEIGFLAERLARTPALAALPWSAFGGFVIERVLVCVWHAAFVAVPVFAAARRPALIPLALLAAMALHFIGNFPIYLSAIGAFGIAREVWPLAVFGWTILYTIVLALLMAFLWTRPRGESLPRANMSA